MFNLPNLFTAANLFCGVIATFLAMNGRIDLAPFFIIGGLLFDFFDGFLARKLQLTGELGKQLDSLADMVTFGVAPGAIIFSVLVVINEPSYLELYDVHAATHYALGKWFMNISNSIVANPFPVLALFIPFFSLFRLAKFNLDSRQSQSFIGLPTPAHSLFYLSFPLVLCYGEAGFGMDFSLMKYVFNPYVIIACIAVLSVMTVSELPLFSLKFKTFGFAENKIRYIFLLISLGLIIFFQAWSLALIVFLYLILSVIENILQKEKS